MAYPDADAMSAIQPALAALSSHGRPAPTLVGLLDAWKAMVAAVEEGYDWSIEEYLNDLTCRTHLDRVRQAAPVVDEWLRSELAPWDQRFLDATRPASTAGASVAFTDRVPLRPGPELARDVDQMGL